MQFVLWSLAWPLSESFEILTKKAGPIYANDFLLCKCDTTVCWLTDLYSRTQLQFSFLSLHFYCIVDLLPIRVLFWSFLRSASNIPLVLFSDSVCEIWVITRHPAFNIEHRWFTTITGFTFDLEKALGEDFTDAIMVVAKRLQKLKLTQEETFLIKAFIIFFTGRKILINYRFYMCFTVPHLTGCRHLQLVHNH